MILKEVGKLVVQEDGIIHVGRNIELNNASLALCDVLIGGIGDESELGCRVRGLCIFGAEAVAEIGHINEVELG